MAWNDNNDHQGMGDKKDNTDWEVQLENKWNDFKQKFQKKYSHYGKRSSLNSIFKYFFASLVIAWLCSGIYIVDQGNRGIVTRFGAYTATTMPGPHWHWPLPIEDIAIVNVKNQRFIEVGYQSGNPTVLPESLMLTKDENIVSLTLAVQYQIKNARDYLFNVKDNERTLKQVTESIQRGVIGKNTMDFILTEGRSQIVSDIKSETQKAIDAFGTGLQVTSVNLQDAQPPEEVQSAFEDAIRAREDKQRLINEAQAYANEIIPKARGAAARLNQEAEGYEVRIVERAKGESERFDQLLVEYEKAPKVTRKRLYLEAKEKLYRNTNKVLVNVENGNNMFYMPLNQLAQTNSNLNQNSNFQKSTMNQKNIRDSERNSSRKNNSGIRSSRSKK